MANKLYQEASVQAIADALRLKRDGGTDTYAIGDMDDGVLSLPFGNIPEYHTTEAGRVVKRLLELKALHPNSIIFGTISDNHVDKSTASTMISARHAAYALEAVGRMACDFVANLGDNIAGSNGIDNDTNYTDAVYMENAIRYALTSQQSFNLIGNHDKSNSTQKLYNMVGKYNVFDSYGTTRIRGYGYKDFTDKKVRVIVLNTCDYWNVVGGNGMSYEQKDFFMRALDLSASKITNADLWTIIILSHIPLDFLGGDYNKGSDLKAILRAYNDGTSVSIAINSSYASAQGETVSNYDTFNGSNSLVYDYSGKNCERVVNIHGHIHTNAYGKLTFIDDGTVLDIYRVSTPNSSFNGNASTNRYTEYGNYSITSSEAAKIAKVTDSKADTSATFYFFDLDDQTIYSVGYGADIDRTLSYKKTNVYSITYKLTNVTSSNNSGSVNEGSGYSCTLVPGANYKIDTVVVTMGGIDVTSSVYANGIINIGSVTGNIVVTATGSPAVNYTNLFSTSDPNYSVGRLNSSGAVNTSFTSGFVSGFIPVTFGTDVIRARGTTAFGSNYGCIAFYKSDKSFINQGYVHTDYVTVSANGMEIMVDTSTMSTSVYGASAFFRIMGYGSAADFVITKNEEIK